VRRQALERLAFGRKIGFEIGFAMVPIIDLMGYIGFDLSILFLQQSGHLQR